MQLFSKNNLLAIENENTDGSPGRLILAGPDTGCADTACAMMIIPPGGGLPLHYHKMRETWFVMVSGELEMTCNDKVFTLTSGDCMFIPSHEIHGSRNRGVQEVKYLEIWTYPEVEQDFFKAESA